MIEFKDFNVEVTKGDVGEVFRVLDERCCGDDESPIKEVVLALLVAETQIAMFRDTFYDGILNIDDVLEGIRLQAKENGLALYEGLKREIFGGG